MSPRSPHWAQAAALLVADFDAAVTEVAAAAAAAADSVGCNAQVVPPSAARAQTPRCFSFGNGDKTSKNSLILQIQL